MPDRTYEAHCARRERYSKDMASWPNALAASLLGVSTRTVARYRRELGLPTIDPGIKPL